MSDKAEAGLAETLVPPPPETAQTFPLLDTLRAIGAVCVLTTHTAFWAGDYVRHGTLGSVLARLDVGVAIFFVLSGFLLSRAWLVRAADGETAPRAAPYFWKRALRIVPVYVITVVLAMTFVEANDSATPRDWLSTLLMLDVYHGEGFPDGLTQMWSLAAEVAFYAVLPLLMLALLGRGKPIRPGRVMVGLVLMVSISVWWHVDGASHVGQGRPLEWLPGFLTWFAAGILLALAEVLHRWRQLPRLTGPFVALARQPGTCWAIVAGLMLISATPLAGPTMLAAPSTAQSLTKHLLYAAVGFLIVLTGVFADPDSRYSRVMGYPLGRRLGWISYGVFCLHLPVLHFVMWATGWELFVGRGLAIWALTVVLSLIAAEVSYRVVERPALRLKRVWDRPGRTAATNSPTTDTSIR